MMQDHGYYMIVQKSVEDNCYIAYAPDLIGCMSDGNTPATAIYNLLHAIQEWLDETKRLNRIAPTSGKYDPQYFQTKNDYFDGPNWRDDPLESTPIVRNKFGKNNL